MFNFKTREGLQNLINVVATVLMTCAAAFFGWGESTPEVTPLPDVVVIEQYGVQGTEESVPLFSIIGFDTRSEAEDAATKITEPKSNNDNAAVAGGLSIGAILTLVNFLLGWFGSRIKQPADLQVFPIDGRSA